MHQHGHFQMRPLFPACTWLPSCCARTWKAEQVRKLPGVSFCKGIMSFFLVLRICLIPAKVMVFHRLFHLANSYLLCRSQLKITFSRKSSLNCHTRISHNIGPYILSSCLLHTNYLCSLKMADMVPVSFNFISIVVSMAFVT